MKTRTLSKCLSAIVTAARGVTTPFHYPIPNFILTGNMSNGRMAVGLFSIGSLSLYNIKSQAQ